MVNPTAAVAILEDYLGPTKLVLAIKRAVNSKIRRQFRAFVKAQQ